MKGGRGRGEKNTPFSLLSPRPLPAPFDSPHFLLTSGSGAFASKSPAQRQNACTAGYVRLVWSLSGTTCTSHMSQANSSQRVLYWQYSYDRVTRLYSFDPCCCFQTQYDSNTCTESVIESDFPWKGDQKHFLHIHRYVIIYLIHILSQLIIFTLTGWFLSCEFKVIYSPIHRWSLSSLNDYEGTRNMMTIQ